jgi:hypothetical protein
MEGNTKSGKEGRMQKVMEIMTDKVVFHKQDATSVWL